MVGGNETGCHENTSEKIVSEDGCLGGSIIKTQNV